MPGTEKAVSLDLDGIAFRLLDHCGEYGVAARLLSEVKVVEGLGPGLDKLINLGFKILGNTNQPDVARNKFTEPDFLTKKHAMLLATYPQFESIKNLYICPHTETDGCNCRKPKPGLLLQASKDHNLDLAQCWMVGDSGRDIEAGIFARCKTIFVRTGWNHGNYGLRLANYIVNSPAAALDLIVMVVEGKSNTHDL